MPGTQLFCHFKVQKINAALKKKLTKTKAKQKKPQVGNQPGKAEKLLKNKIISCAG